jgi:uncharacterized SAM-binding protein YcdF (DUF218 family)
MFVLALIALPLIAVGGSVYFVNRTASAVDTTKTDAIVVLGAAQFDGTPSPVLEARLSHAADLYQQGVAPLIVTVGGKQSGDRFTEAGAGRAWLIDQGIDRADIYAVGQGADTVTSMTNVADLAKRNGWTSITLDSDPAHMARTQAIANRLGFDAYPNPTQSGDGSQVTQDYIARETFAYLAFELLEQWDVPRIIE